MMRCCTVHRRDVPLAPVRSSCQVSNEGCGKVLSAILAQVTCVA